LYGQVKHVSVLLVASRFFNSADVARTLEAGIQMCKCVKEVHVRAMVVRSAALKYV
jgi:hypothetical protein